MARSGTAHLQDSPVADPLQHTMSLPPTWALEVAPTPVRVLIAKFLEARRPILCDMLVLRLPTEGEASFLDLTSETEKLYRPFDGTMIGQTGRGGIESFQLVTEIHFRHETLVPFTLETGPCRQTALDENPRRLRQLRQECRTPLPCGTVLLAVVHLCALEDE